MAHSFDLEVHRLLASWARWVRTDGTGLGYKSPMAMLMCGHVVESKKPMRAAFINDDNALKVEGLITKLCEHETLTGKVLILHYVENMSAGAIAKHFQSKDDQDKVSRYEVTNRIAYGVGFMTSALGRAGMLEQTE